ncbi:MAG: hypothetical protein J6K42_01135 [Clostridia bacterium]|nr:hypothetical protein [Clostridia bacterium]
MANEKKIKVVSGKGKNLKISNVKDHLDIEKPKEDVDKEKIIIPTKKK